MPYESPNIVIVPSLPLNKKKIAFHPPQKLGQTDKIVPSLSTETSKNVQIPNSSDILPKMSPTTTQEPLKDSDMPESVKTDCATLEKDKNEVGGTITKLPEVLQSELVKNTSTKSLEDSKNVKKPSASWASNYLQSIGQCNNPIKQNLASKIKSAQEVNTLENKSGQIKLNLLSDEKIKNFNGTEIGKPRLDTKTWLTQGTCANASYHQSNYVNANEFATNLCHVSGTNYANLTPYSTPGTDFRPLIDSRSWLTQPTYTHPAYHPYEGIYINNHTHNVHYDLQNCCGNLIPHYWQNTSFRPLTDTPTWFNQMNPEISYSTNQDINTNIMNFNTHSDLQNNHTNYFTTVQNPINQMPNTYNEKEKTSSDKYDDLEKKIQIFLESGKVPLSSSGSQTNPKDPVSIQKDVGSYKRIDKEIRKKEATKIKQAVKTLESNIKNIISDKIYKTSKPAASKKEISESYKKDDVEKVILKTKTESNKSSKRKIDEKKPNRDEKSTNAKLEKSVKSILKSTSISPEQSKKRIRHNSNHDEGASTNTKQTQQGTDKNMESVFKKAVSSKNSKKRIRHDSKEDEVVSLNTKKMQKSLEPQIKKKPRAESKTNNRTERQQTVPHAAKKKKEKSIRRKTVNDRPNSENNETSQNKRVRRSSSQNNEFPLEKRFRHNPENEDDNNTMVKKLSPIKSIVQLADKLQVKHPRIQAPESDSTEDDNEADFDLRSRLSRKIYANQVRHDIELKEKTETPHDNLVITINRNEDDEINIKPPSQGPSKSKVKTKRYKKIQLVINVMCQNSENSSDDSASDDNDSKEVVSENHAVGNMDLSFLDDFNIDEIVNSLKPSPKKVNMQQDLSQTVLANNTEHAKKPAKPNKFVQPIIIKSEIKTEYLETEIQPDILHNDTSNNQQNLEDKTSNDVVQTDTTLCDIQTPINIIAEIKDNSAIALIKDIKQEKHDNANQNTDEENTGYAYEFHQSPSFNGNVHQTVKQFIDLVSDNAQSHIDIPCPVATLNHNIKSEPCENDGSMNPDNSHSIYNLEFHQSLNDDVHQTVNRLIDLVSERVQTHLDILCPVATVDYAKSKLCEIYDGSTSQVNNSKSLKDGAATADIFDKVEKILTDSTHIEPLCLESNILCDVTGSGKAIETNGQEVNNNDMKLLCEEVKINNDDAIGGEKVTETIKKEMEIIDSCANADVDTIKTMKEDCAKIDKSEKDDVIKIKTEGATTKVNPSEDKLKNINKPLANNTETQNTALLENQNVDTITGTVNLTKENKVMANDIEQRIFEYLHIQLRVTSLIRQGKFSKVFKCNGRSGEQYAIKLLKNERDRHSLGIEKEKMLKQLQSDIPKEKLNTAYFIEGFGIGRIWCFLMEYYPKNLCEVMLEKSFHIDEVQVLARQLASAILVMRNNNIVHSDIKPGHILLDASNQNLKVCGFDEAYYAGSVKVLPNIGSLPYRAPEIILGYSADFNIDVWATAVVLYEMVTNMKLFKGIYNNDVLHQQMCLLGNLSMDMKLTSPFSSNHFYGGVFVRRVGFKGQNSIFIKNFFKTTKIRNSLFASYNRSWGMRRSKLHRVEDLTKLKLFARLLLQMLDLDPRRRLPIEYVYTHPFLYESSA